MGVSVDWYRIEELPEQHVPGQVQFDYPQGSYGYPYGCTDLPVSDPENWNFMSWSYLPDPIVGFALHNTSYRITVQWRYGVYMKGQRGPFQTSITINVRNLVVTSPDETKVLKWDPVRGIADTTFSYSLECAQKKVCQVHISIYSTEGVKVYEEWLEQLAPGSYSFTWDGRVNVMPPPPDGLAEAGLYVFDVEVIGAAPFYDEDTVRSRMLRIGEHETRLITHRTIEAKYVLRSNRDASQAWVEVWRLSDLERLAGPIQGPTHAIPENASLQESDYNIVQVSVSIEYASPYGVLFWARDNFPDYDKSHRKKLCFVNQKKIWKGWFMAIGVKYAQVRGLGWSAWSALFGQRLNTSKLPDTAKEMLEKITFKDQRGNEWTVSWETSYQYLNGTTDNLLFKVSVENPFSAEQFVDKLNSLVDDFYMRQRIPKKSLPNWCGIIYFTGHGGKGGWIGLVHDYQDSIFGVNINPQDPPPNTSENANVSQIKTLYPVVRLIYLSACKVTDKNGGGLVGALAQKGAKAVVGFHITIEGKWNPPNRQVDWDFWAALTGRGKYKGKPQNVAKAAQDAAARALSNFLGRKRGVKWQDACGIAGFFGLADALSTNLIN